MATTNADGYVSTAFRGDGNSVCVLDVTHEYTAGQLAINEVIKIGDQVRGLRAAQDAASAEALKADTIADKLDRLISG